MSLVMTFLAGAVVGGGAKWLYDTQQSKPSVEVEDSAETVSAESDTE